MVDFQQQFLALTPLTDVGVAHLSEHEKKMIDYKLNRYGLSTYPSSRNGGDANQPLAKPRSLVYNTKDPKIDAQGDTGTI